MTADTHFPFFRWVFRKLTGRWARRTYAAILLLLLILTTTVRLRSYFMARRIQAILRGLAQVRVDQTTEEQLTKTLPYLTRNEEEWKNDGITERWYYVRVSNESNQLWAESFFWRFPWAGQLADWLGYRYMSFDASALVQNGRAARVSYCLTKVPVQPRIPGCTVLVDSVHGFWSRGQGPGWWSVDDESPQYHVGQREVPTVVWRGRGSRPEGESGPGIGNESGVFVTFTNDAPPEVRKRTIQLNLSCFWSLRRCGDAREIAPGMWQDMQATREAALQRLQAGKCPDSLIEGRMRYLPDVTVLLLEVTGSREMEVNEEGEQTEDRVTDFKLKEVIRGRNVWSWKNVHFRKMIPSPLDRAQTIANWTEPPTKIGTKVLFFGSLYFDSCQFIPASPSALDIVRTTPVPPRRPEDDVERYKGLQ